MVDHRTTFVALDTVNHRVNQKKKHARTTAKPISSFIVAYSKVPAGWCVTLI